MRLRRPSVPAMRTDDTVAPGILRSRAAWIIGAGLAFVIVGILVTALALSTGVRNAATSAELSSDEVEQMRQFIATRTQQRDAERAAVQAQLDDQRAVLCAAITTLAQSARPAAKPALATASADLRCTELSRPTGQ